MSDIILPSLFISSSLSDRKVHYLDQNIFDYISYFDDKSVNSLSSDSQIPDCK